MKKLIALGTAVAAVLALSVSAGAAPCCIVNGSFESNNLTGWTTSGAGESSGTAGGGAAGQGSYYGWVNTASSAETFAGISQSFFAPAGRVYGWAKFDNGETGGFCDLNDEARVRVDGQNVFYASSYSTGSTGWVPWSKWVGGTGNHAVQAQVLNDADDLCDSQIDVDGITWNAALAKLPPP